MINFAVIEITECCNLNCSHCYLASKGTETLSSKDIRFIIDNLESIGCKRITISGGEPFYVPEIFEEIVKYAASKDFYIAVVTNGTLFDRVNLDVLKKIDYIQVSLDGLKDTHDKIRGIGTFDMVMNGISFLLGYGYQEKIAAQMTVSSINQYEFFDVYNLILKLNIKMSVERVTIVGNAMNYNMLDFDQYVKILDCVIDNTLLSSDPLVNVRKLQRLGINPRYVPLDVGCSAGRNGIAIEVDGDVLPCVRIRKSCGNMFSTDLNSIISSDEYKKYAIPNGQCNKCNYSDICGGCKADLLSTESKYCYI